MSVAPIDDQDQMLGEDEPKKTNNASLWKRLKKKWTHYGVVEIAKQHRRYELLNCIREGIQQLLNNRPQLGPKESLTDEDYTAMHTEELTSPSGKRFTFTSHASSVFASIRHAVGVSEDEYRDTLAPEGLPYMQYISNSKGGADFFLSNDKSYFLKTEKPYYLGVFKSFLRDYLNHFMTYPHSLIVKIIGLYTIQLAGGSKLNFFVMQSIFYPDNRIKDRFDLKGCLVGRYQKPPKPSSEGFSVLKDENFKTEKIQLGGQKDWFLTQLRCDTQFLTSLGVIDYSLLVGRHEILEGDREKSLGSLVLRTRLSLVGGSTIKRRARSLSRSSISPLRSVATTAAVNTATTAADPSAGHKGTSPVARAGARSESVDKGADGQDLEGPPETDSVKEQEDERLMSFIFMQNDADPSSQNRRLLPNVRNSLHIIDGEDERYFLGIIDFFTLYECRQMVGKAMKTIKFCNSNHSTQTPAVYGERFLQFFNDHTI